MRYVEHQVKCDGCSKEIITTYKIDDNSNDLFTIVVKCECGGKFKRVDNYIE